MDINQINERLKNLYALKKVRDIYNTKAVLYQNEGVQFETAAAQIEKPITDKLGIEGKQTREKLELEGKQIRKEIEGVKNEIENQARMNELQYDEDKIEPVFYSDLEVNTTSFGNAQTIIPTIGKIRVHDKEFQSVTINNNDFIIGGTQSDETTYIFKYTTSQRYKKFILTSDVLNLIIGNFEMNMNVNEMRVYLSLLKEAGSSMRGNYIKNIKEAIKMGTQTGEGINRSVRDKTFGFKLKPIPTNQDPSVINQNPIRLFAELYKMLAAKKAGHNNLDRPIKGILTALVPHMRKEKYNRILKKYNLR